eukprot:6731998-Alexandrium_andersonii.AAC.1
MGTFEFVSSCIQTAWHKKGLLGEFVCVDACDIAQAPQKVLRAGGARRAGMDVVCCAVPRELA